MRSPVKSFRYVATVGPEDFKTTEVSVTARAAESEAPPFLAGPSPRLRFIEDRVVLVTSPPGASPLKWCAFPAGDVIPIGAEPGDTVAVSRVSDGGMTIALTRKGQLRLAVGALFGHDLVPGLSLTRDPAEFPFHRAAMSSLMKFTEGAADEPIVHGMRPPPRVIAASGDVHYTLATRESVAIAGYDLYVERIEPLAVFGEEPHECLSLADMTDSKLVNAARRSATLMAQGHSGRLRGEAGTGKMLKSEYDIDSAWREADEAWG